MPRPSQAQDQALLLAGRQLYAEFGCAGLSVRKVAEAAGVNPAMVHYHFKNKDGFLRALLQQIYEELFAGLSLEAGAEGSPLQRLRACLLSLARFIGEHRPLIARVWSDASSGEKVALEFMCANAPRHLGLLLQLLGEAQAAGELQPGPPLPRFVFLMGSVIAPLLVAGGALSLGIVPPPIAAMVKPLVLSDDAVAARIDLALTALKSEGATP